MAKKPQQVFVLVRTSPDVSKDFVDIRGIFSTKEAAMATRQKFWDLWQLKVEVQPYFLQETIT